jgi:hypothetical protein
MTQNEKSNEKINPHLNKERITSEKNNFMLKYLGMTSSRVVRASQTVLCSIQASSDTVESEGAAGEAVLNKEHRKNAKNSPV